MKLFKLFAYLFVYGIILVTLLQDYPPKDVYSSVAVALCVGGAAILAVATLNRAAFWIDIENPYVVGGWVSLALFLYILLEITPYGEELYTFFILAAAAIVGLLNIDRPKYVLVQHEPTSSSAFVRGMMWGLLSYVAASLILTWAIGLENVGATMRLAYIGPLTLQLEEWFDIGITFLIMLFIVAVPEEIMARVFYFRMGSAVTDVFTASLLTLVTGYAMHAYSRYDIEYGTLALLVIVVVWLMITLAYVRHGILASIAAHATYNSLITAAMYGWEYVVAATLIILIVAFSVLYREKQVVWL